MDSHKIYHVDGFDSRLCLDTYCSNKPDMVFADECLKFPMEKLHHVFSLGHIKGEHLVDISSGPLVYHLYSASGFFNHIHLLHENCIMEMNRWLHTRTGAFDWNHTSTYVTELEGNNDQWDDKEIRLKEAIKQIVKCDTDKENLTDPIVLPPADCVISAWLLELISKDRDGYILNLKKVANFIKPGGYLILFAVLNATYFMIGEDRFHIFKHDEDYVREVLTREGFIIDHCDVLSRKSVSEYIDYDGTLFIAAQKKK